MEQSIADIVRQQGELLKIMQLQLGALTTSHTNIHVPWPTPININIDPEEAFKIFNKQWNNYCRATQIDKWPPTENTRKVSVLFTAIGEEALKKYNNFNLQNPEELQYEEILKIISSKLVPRRNIIYNRYIFNNRNQNENEEFELYYSDLVKLIEDCDYKDMKDDLLRDKIVIGIKDIQLKKELLKKDNLTLKDAIHICRAAEVTNQQMLNLSNVEAIKKVESEKQGIRTGKCKFCGNIHKFQKGICPAWGKVCENCKGKNHLGKVCKKKNKVKEIDLQINKQHTTSESSENSTEMDIIINKLSTCNEKQHAKCTLQYKREKKWTDIVCLIDTGADECLIGYDNLFSLFDKEFINRNLKVSNKTLYDFSNHKIMIHGEIDLLLRKQLENKISTHKVTFQVVHMRHIPLISFKVSTNMGLIKMCKEIKLHTNNTNTHHIINKYDSVFQGQGRFSGDLNLEFDDNVRPVIQKARRVPLALRKPLKEELQNLEKQGIIQKEENHTDWVSNILIVKKNNNFRICLDPIPLNKAIKRPNYQFTTIDEVLPELGTAKIFSTFDVKKGFWHIGLSDESSKLTTFWTPFGKYRWKVLPFGISSSSDYFQMRMFEIVHDLPGVEILVDDILVYGVGESMEEAIADHNIKLEKLMQRLIKHNCKLNKKKMKLLQTSVQYYGHIFTTDGLQPDPSKIKCIVNIPVPTNKKELQRFLGMITYLSRFIPNLSDNSTYLRHLTHDKSDWIWNKHADKEFNRLKILISDIKTLKYFDRNKPLVIECDSSCAALGVAVLQDNQPVAYASRTLTPTERKYAQIEKELLAIVFACTRFDQLIIGNYKTIIKTDHKPLLNIFKKPLLHAPKRLQSMLLILQRYRLELQFVSGKENILADALSRFYIECDDMDSVKEQKIFKIINRVNPLQSLQISDKYLEQIIHAARNDNNYNKIKEFVLHGWPKYIQDIPDCLKPYYSYKEELTTYKDLILKNQSIVIPESIRKQTLLKLHKAHSGIENTLKLARDVLFWPSMSTEIKDMIKSCSVCNKHLPSQQRFTMQSHRIPDYPFQMVSMDVFFFSEKGKQAKYLITIDHYSDFFELDKLKDLSARSVIETCKRNFSRHGIPEIVCTDGGTNFVNQEFVQFSQNWNFTHVTSSPNHPQGNGKAEATVKIAKNLLVKSTENNEDIWQSLLTLRNTPNKINSSPVQRIFSRRTRGFLPILPTLLTPKIIQNVHEDIQRKKEKYKHYYDKRSVTSRKLEIGQPVIVQLHPSINKYWTPGHVEDILSDRSYLVNVNDSIYRRDLLHIRPCDIDDTKTKKDSPPSDNITQLIEPEPLSTNTTLTHTDAHNTTSPPLITEHTQNTLDQSNDDNNAQNSDMSNTNKNCNTNNSHVHLRSRREIKKPLYLNEYIC